MIRSFIAFSDGLSRIGGIVATLLLVAAMVVISEMIFLRYVFRAPTYWETDFVVFSATAAIFIGAPYVLLRKGHVGVDVIETLLADRARSPAAGRLAVQPRVLRRHARDLRPFRL